MNGSRRPVQDLNADEHSCAAWIARFLKARGIDRIFGLQGGHIQPIWDHVARHGIRIIDVRDEGAAVHMAHAHAELTGAARRRHGDGRPGRDQHRDRDGQRLARARAGAADRRLHVAAAGEHGTAAGHPARRHPAAGHPRRRAPRGWPTRSCASSTRRSRARWATWASRARSMSRSRPTCCARTVPPQLVLDEWMQAEAAARVCRPIPTRSREAVEAFWSAKRPLVITGRGARRRRRRAGALPRRAPARSISTRRKAAASCRPTIPRSSAPCAPPR